MDRRLCAIAVCGHETGLEKRRVGDSLAQSGAAHGASCRMMRYKRRAHEPVGRNVRNF